MKVSDMGVIPFSPQTYRTMHKRLVTARQRSGLTTDEFARVIGVGAKLWRAFENGHHLPERWELVAIAGDELGLHGRLLIEGPIPTYRPRAR